MVETEMIMAQTVIDWSRCPVLERIPGKVSGAWLFRGTRVPVSAILKNLKEMSVQEVVQEFPSVTPYQVYEVLDFLAQSADPVIPSNREAHTAG